MQIQSTAVPVRSRTHLGMKLSVGRLTLDLFIRGGSLYSRGGISFIDRRITREGGGSLPLYEAVSFKQLGPASTNMKE